MLVTGYNERFARRFGRMTRTIARHRRLVAPHDKRAEDEWHTPTGGQLMTRGVGSPPTGVGFNLIVIDDPIRSRAEADSEAYRERVADWYFDDLYTRLEPGGAIVLVMTRWHEDDIAARAIAAEPNRWTILNLPAVSDEGVPLWPERYPLEALQRIKTVLTREQGSRSWEALYQQRPTAAEGNLFLVGNLIFADTAPPIFVKLVRAWDLAATKGAGDYTVGVLVGITAEGDIWVLDVLRGQWDPAERDRRIRDTAERDGPLVMIHYPQDPGQAGKSQVAAIARLLHGFSYKSQLHSGPKEVRAGPASSGVNSGLVHVLRRPWTGDFVEELRSFPAGRHDDQVDAFADAYVELARHQASWDDVLHIF